MTHHPITKDPLDSLLTRTASERQISRPSDSRDGEQSSHTASESNESILIRPASQPDQLSREPGFVYSARSGSPAHLKSSDEDLRETIFASFAPRIAVVASEDTDEIAKEKGFSKGFYGLLRPFGEKVSGKVVIRDSVGASKTWENFGVRLIQCAQDQQPVSSSTDQKQSKQGNESQVVKEYSPQSSSSPVPYDQQDPINAIIEVSLQSMSVLSESSKIEHENDEKKLQSQGKPSSTYVLYIRKLLSGTLQVPHETFCHPVACIIAVSSRNQGPLETIRQLYSISGRANIKIPPWVSVDYLRYYVLVHDEDRDDVTKSTALFDLMKRHFGLHCYLLRIRSAQCVETDDDSFPMPECIWTSAAEEKEDLEESGK